METVGTEQEFAEAVARLNEKYAVTMLGGTAVVIDQTGVDFNGNPCDSFVRIPECVRYHSNDTFLVTNNNGKGLTTITRRNVFKSWLNSPDRKSFDGVIFHPGSNAPANCYNLWRGFAIEPIAGDCSLFWNHLQEVICDGNEEAAIYLKQYMAHMVQKPDELPEVALVMRGQQGIGKDVFLSALQEIFGKHYLVLSNMEDVTSKFNGPMMDKIVIQANEAIWGGEKKNEGVLKTLVTDRTRKYEFKGKDIIQANNYSRLIIVSNNDWVVAVDKDDRRYVFFNVSSKYKGNTDYFDRLLAQLKDGGYNAILHDLLSMDISQFNPRKRPQNLVDAGTDQIYMRMTPIELYIEGALQTGYLAKSGVSNCGRYPGYRRIPFNELYNDFIEYCEVSRVNFIPSVKEFSHKVFGYSGKQGLVPMQGKYQHSDEYGKKTVCYAIPSLSECRRYFEQYVMGGRTIDWDDETPTHELMVFDDTPDPVIPGLKFNVDKTESTLESQQDRLVESKKIRELEAAEKKKVQRKREANDLSKPVRGASRLMQQKQERTAEKMANIEQKKLRKETLKTVMKTHNSL